MILTYYGHSCFKIAGATGTVVTDPFSESVGFSLPSLSADMVTVSHDHADHNAVSQIRGTARREKPFIVSTPGEYEVQMISVFGTASWHDETEGAQRGPNTIFTVYLDGLRVCHLGDLGHQLTKTQQEAIGDIDVLLCPVGGQFTIDPEGAIKVIRALEPSIVIPMHYRTPAHESLTFGGMATVENFLTVYGTEVEPVPKLSLSAGKLPEETEVVVLQAPV